MNLSTLNEAHERVVDEYFRSCCASPVFVMRMERARPYGDLAAVLAAVDDVFASLTDAEIDAAIAAHPRIGERPEGQTVEEAHSRREQVGMEDADETVRRALRRANAAYESRFDRVFLIRAAGRTPQEMLDEARRRIENDPVTELAEVREQLRQITRLRIEQSLEASAGQA